jgi:hypothetical protein
MALITKCILKKFGGIDLIAFTNAESLPAEIDVGQWRTEKTILTNGTTSTSIIPQLAPDVSFDINIAEVKKVSASLYTALTQYEMSNADPDLGPCDMVADLLGQLSFGKTTLMKPAGIPTSASKNVSITINVSKR